MPKPSQSEIDRLQDRLNSDPEFVNLVKQLGQTGHAGLRAPQDWLKAHGIQLPHDYAVGIGPNGEVVVKEKNFFERNPWFAPVLGVGIATGVGAATAGAAGGATGGATAGGTTAATTGGTAAGTTAAASTPLWKSLLPTIIGAGATVGGQAIASHGNTQAAKIAAEQADRAMALQKEIFDIRRKDEEQYRALGNAAVGGLAYLSGYELPPPSSATPTPQTGAQPSQGFQELGGSAIQAGQQGGPVSWSPRTILAQFGDQSQATKIKAPNGNVYNVPPMLVADALKNGGTRV